MSHKRDRCHAYSASRPESGSDTSLKSHNPLQTKAGMGNAQASRHAVCCVGADETPLSKADYEEAFHSYGARETALSVFMSTVQWVYFERIRTKHILSERSGNRVCWDDEMKLTARGIHYVSVTSDDKVAGAVRGFDPATHPRGVLVVHNSHKGGTVETQLEQKGYPRANMRTHLGKAGSIDIMAVSFAAAAAEPPKVVGKLAWGHAIGHPKFSPSGFAGVYRYTFDDETIELDMTQTNLLYYGVRVGGERIDGVAQRLGVDPREPLERSMEMEDVASADQRLEKIAGATHIPDNIQKKFGRKPGTNGMEKKLLKMQLLDKATLIKLIAEEKYYHVLLAVVIRPDDTFAAPAGCAGVLTSSELSTPDYVMAVQKLCSTAQSK